MEKIKTTGTSTEFDKGFKKAVDLVIAEIQQIFISKKFVKAIIKSSNATVQFICESKGKRKVASLRKKLDDREEEIRKLGNSCAEPMYTKIQETRRMKIFVNEVFGKEQKEGGKGK